MLECPYCKKKGIVFFKKIFSRQSMPVICSECGKPSFLSRKRNLSRLIIELFQVLLFFSIPLFLLVKGYGINSVIVYMVFYFLLNIAYSIYWRYKAPLIETCEFMTTWARRSNLIFVALLGLLALFLVIKNSP